MPEIAGSIDLSQLMAALASRRPVFHSEADFQHAFAWQAHLMDPLIEVRLETHPEPNVRLDLLVARPDLNASTAIELKYLTAPWAGQISGETFALKSQGAQDIRAYDVVKDLERVERFVRAASATNGVVIVLTNHPGYWRPVTHGRETNADSFRIYEGVPLSGTRNWGPRTGAGTTRGREKPLNLMGNYQLSWSDYSRIDGRNGHLRALVIPVERQG